MRMRLGPGPVFVYEWIVSARRWQFYACGRGLCWRVLAGIVFIWRTDPHRRSRPDGFPQRIRAGWASSFT